MKQAACPQCRKPVLEVKTQASTVQYVHAYGGRENQVAYGCTISRLAKKGQ